MIDVRRLGPQIGAETRGVDVKKLDDAGFATIYRAWLDCNIVVVPDQELEIVDKFGPDGALSMAIYRRGAEGWHTDGAYDEEPFKATQLYALAVPSRGGDTFFASMYAAYEALPEGQYRHRWSQGDVVIWDNRCSYHKAAGDYPPEEDRIHWRASIKEVC